MLTRNPSNFKHISTNREHKRKTKSKKTRNPQVFGLQRRDLSLITKEDVLKYDIFSFRVNMLVFI